MIPEGRVVPEECWYLGNADTRAALVLEMAGTRKALVQAKSWCQQNPGISVIPEQLMPNSVTCTELSDAFLEEDDPHGS